MKDRSGYEVVRYGCMNVDVAATGGSRSSSTVNALSALLSNSEEPDPDARQGK